MHDFIPNPPAEIILLLLCLQRVVLHTDTEVPPNFLTSEKMHRKLKLLFGIKCPQVHVVLSCAVVQSGITSKRVMSMKSHILF